MYLVGGGPGSVELLTLKAVQCLSSADVVLLDHLAPQDIASFAPNAQIIEVGKNPGKHVVPQSHIQQLILALALSGKTVVRLKGGDPFVFGRGAEELDACTAAGIECTVVPGGSRPRAGRCSPPCRPRTPPETPGPWRSARSSW